MSPQMSAEVETDIEGGRRELPTGMLERVTLVLDAFDRRSTKLNLGEVARRTCLPRSTTHRILEQLVSMEWLQHSHPGYGFGRRGLGLKRPYEDCHTELRQAAEPYLHGLRMRTGMAVLLSVLEGTEEVVLDKIGVQHASRMGPAVGHRSASHVSASGRAMLSALPPGDVDDLSLQLLATTEPTSGASVSSVIRGPAGLLAAISLRAAPGERAVERAESLVLSAAQRVSRELCQQDASPLQPARNV